MKTVRQLVLKKAGLESENTMKHYNSSFTSRAHGFQNNLFVTFGDGETPGSIRKQKPDACS